MSLQKTLSIIKPDAYKAGHANAINLMIENGEENNFLVKGLMLIDGLIT